MGYLLQFPIPERLLDLHAEHRTTSQTLEIHLSMRHDAENEGAHPKELRAINNMIEFLKNEKHRIERAIIALKRDLEHQRA